MSLINGFAHSENNIYFDKNSFDPFADGSGIAFYKFDGDSLDTSGTFNGTPTNITYDTGKIGQSAVFNGSTSLVATTPTALSTTSDNSNFSVSLWAMMPALFTSSYKGLLGGTGTTVYPVFDASLVYVSSNTYRVNSHRSFGGKIYSNSSQFGTFNINAGDWFNVIISYTVGKNITVYVNGVSKGTINLSSSNTISSVSQTINIGQYFTGFPSYAWNGRIDNLRYFNKALTLYEANTLYLGENNVA